MHLKLQFKLHFKMHFKKGATFQHILKTLQHIPKTLQHISLFNTFFNQNAKKKTLQHIS